MQIQPLLIYDVIRAGLIPCVETNGTMGATGSTPPSLISSALHHCREVVVSPKSNKYDREILHWANCLKVLVPFVGGITSELVLEMTEHLGKHRAGEKHLIFQPLRPIPPKWPDDDWKEENDAKTWRENCAHAVFCAFQFGQEYGQTWRVIPQTHVYMELR